MMKHESIIILHTHLPYVLNHGSWPHGSDWLCEAVAECYVPILDVFHQVLDEGISPNLTVDISPILCEQLENELFPRLFEKYCKSKARLAVKDFRTFQDPMLKDLARFWEEWYISANDRFQSTYQRSIVGTFRQLQNDSHIEIMTCGLTHGYLPLLGDDASVGLQISAAARNYEKHFGRCPAGIWLPECAYRPSYPWRTLIQDVKYSVERNRKGVEQFLEDAGISYFVVDEHLKRESRLLDTRDSESALLAKSPLKTATVGSGKTSIFTRDQRSALRVWSADSGYPGDGVYLDFHKKSNNSGIRYWRITDRKLDMAFKEIYDPIQAYERVDRHAQDFVSTLENRVLSESSKSRNPLTLCTPYDTELFGHWWFEGPYFLRSVIQHMKMNHTIEMKTASQSLNDNPPRHRISIPEGSWGAGGNHDVWIADSVQWTWKYIYRAEQRFDSMIALLAKSNDEIERFATELLRLALVQLTLLQSSDWQFVIKTGGAVDYGQSRFLTHLRSFNKLCNYAQSIFEQKTLLDFELREIKDIAERDDVFPELKVEDWRSAHLRF